MSRCPSWLLVVVIALVWANLAQAMTPAQEATRLKLATPMDVNYVKCPLGEVLSDIATQAGVEIICDDASLRAAEVTPDSEVTVRFALPISAKSVLGLVLYELRLTYTVRHDGRIEVVDINHRVDLVEKVYHLSPGLKKTSDKSSTSGFSEADAQREAKEFVNDVMRTIEGGNWYENGGWGTITAIENGPAIVVSQSPRVHDSILRLLAQESRIREPRVVVTVEHLELDERQWRPLKRQRNAAGHSQIAGARQKSLRERLDFLYSTRAYWLSQDELVNISMGHQEPTPPGAVPAVQIQASLQKDNQLLIAVAPRSEERERFSEKDFAVVPPGEALLIPVSENFPGKAIRFDDGTRHVLMLTPRVLLPDSDENVVYTLRN